LLKNSQKALTDYVQKTSSSIHKIFKKGKTACCFKILMKSLKNFMSEGYLKKVQG